MLFVHIFHYIVISYVGVNFRAKGMCECGLYQHLYLIRNSSLWRNITLSNAVYAQVRSITSSDSIWGRIPHLSDAGTICRGTFATTKYLPHFTESGPFYLKSVPFARLIAQIHAPFLPCPSQTFYPVPLLLAKAFGNY